MEDEVYNVEKSYQSITELFKDLELTCTKAQTSVNEYQALVNASFGVMPKSPYELAKFIEKVVAYMGITPQAKEQ